MQSQDSTQSTSQGTIGRRDFLKKAAIGAGAAVLACGGLTAIGAYAPPVSCPESDGGAAGGKRVLVAYASVRGSTGEVARTIAETIAARGFRVDLHPVTKPIDVTVYDAVLVGSAIRMARWVPDAVGFVRDHREALSRVPLAYFTVCMTLREVTEQTRQIAYKFIEPVRQILKPAGEGWFAGKYDPDKCALWERVAVSSHQMPAGDFRNWDAIKAWAGEVLS